MVDRGLSLGIGLLLALVIGFGSAVGYHQIKNSPAPITHPSPSPPETPSEVPSPSALAAGNSSWRPAPKRIDSAKPVTTFNLVKPGFPEIGIDGKSPVQLRGFTTTV